MGVCKNCSSCSECADGGQQEYRAQAVEKYGREVVEESENRTAALGKEAVADLQKQWFEICTVIYERRDYGAADKIIQQQVAKLHKWVNNFWECTPVAFRGLGQTYNESPDFNWNITNQFGPEMPAFLEQAITCYCEANANH